MHSSKITLRQLVNSNQQYNEAMHSFGEGQQFEELEIAREQVTRWLAQFAPLVDDHSAMSTRAVKAHLKTLGELQGSSDRVLSNFRSMAQPEDYQLLSTLESAVAQLPSIESDIRLRLGDLAPGDPQSAPDLDELQDKLLQRAARIEIGASTLGQPKPINFVLQEPSKAGFIGALVFGLGWNGFTLFHAIMMIGGMWKAFGPLALLMLFFYAIFFGVGGLMLYGAYAALFKETIRVEGPEIIITKVGWGRTIEKRHRMNRTARAEVTRNFTPVPVMGIKAHPQNSDGKNQSAIVIRDIENKEVVFGMTLPGKTKQDLATQINRHLASLPSEDW